MTHTATTIQDWLISYLSQRMGIEAHEIDTRESFINYGLSSIEGLSLIKQLEEWLGHSLSPTLAWDFPSIDLLARHLGTSQVSAAQNIRTAPIRDEKDAIAIVGMGCRFPKAQDPLAFWTMLCDGVDAITEVPGDRWDINAVYDPDSSKPGKMSSRWGGFVEDIDKFDAQFFGVSPREAAHLDPRQRLIAEVAWEALEDAGIPPLGLAGSKTGVFMGTLSANYGTILFSYYPQIIEVYSGTGNGDSVVANRLSYFLDLRGPSLALNTACSGALVAVHLACQSLRTGESNLALAGGVNVILKPDDTIFFTKTGALSPDGRCKVFDSRANGIVRSEGAGVVVLKRLAEAIADGDPIHAVILGSVINQDGASNGIMAPSGQAQEQMLALAYENAGVSPGQVQYIEAHGTGTAVGDPIEVNALAAVLNIDRQPGLRCALGSVKTNIGHTESASGIAGLIKTVFALKHRQIPGNLHYQEANPLIPFQDIPLFVQENLGPWPAEDAPLIAGVSGFGFSGTNAHVVLTEAPQQHLPDVSDPADQVYLLPISARSPEALRVLAQRYQTMLNQDSAPALRDMIFTAAVRRSHLEYRLGLTAHSQPELAALLEAYLNGEARPGLAQSTRRLDRQPKVAFIFSGQGSHWFQMGRELFEKKAVFRAVMEECDRRLRQHVDWSLLEEIAAPEERSRLDQTCIAQPAIFAVQVALAALWRSWGIMPDLIIGQSVGEVAAAHVAGALSLEDAIRVIFHRSRLMQQVAGQGRTAVVGLPLEQARLVLAGWDDLLSVAGSSSPASSVLSGDPQALERVLKSLEKQGIFCRFLKGVDIAFHSPQMDPLKDELVRSLASIQPQPATTLIFSTVTGAMIEGSDLDAAYWGDNLRQPFLFTQGFKHALDQGYTTFLEVSPHPVLSPSMLESLAHFKKKGVVVPSLRRNEPEYAALLDSLGTFYTLGSAISWRDVYQNAGRHVGLPLYPWQRERYWFDQLIEAQDVSWLSRQFGAPMQSSSYKIASGHPLLGAHVPLAYPAGQHLWELDLSASRPAYLSDHKVQGMVVLPGAAYLEMALSAAQEAFGAGSYSLEEVAFKQAMVLSPTKMRRIEVIFTPESLDRSLFQVFSCPSGEAQPGQTWMLHAAGKILHCPAAPKPEPVSLQYLQARCQESLLSADHYQTMAQRGLNYGPAFQAIKHIWRQDGESLSQLQLPAELEHDLPAYQIHPVLLDASLQAVAAAVPRASADAAEDTRLPVGIASLKLHRPPGTDLWCHAKLRPESDSAGDIREADIDLYDKAGNLVLEIAGLRLQRLESVNAVKAGSIDESFYEIQWQIDQANQPSAASHFPAASQLLHDIEPLVGQLCAEVELDYYEESLIACSNLAALYMLNALRSLGWDLSQPVTTDALSRQLGIAVQHERLFKRILEILQEQQWIAQADARWTGLQTPPQEPTTQVCATLIEKYPANASVFKLVQRCGEQLAGVLAGKVDPLQLLFKDSLIEGVYSESPPIKVFNLLLAELTALALASLPADRTVRILEVGAGTGSLTAALLPKLPAQQTLYTFTDVSQIFLSRAAQQFQEYDFVQYQLLDIERSPLEQGFFAQQYDLIVVSNVLHATSDLSLTLSHIKQLLAPGGMLAFLEGAGPTPWMDVTFGLTSGWWRFSDFDLRPAYPLLSQTQWLDLLTETGFMDVAELTHGGANRSQFIGFAREAQALEEKAAPQPAKVGQPGSWLIFADREGAGEKLAQLFQSRGEPCVVVTAGDSYDQIDPDRYQINPDLLEDFQQLFKDSIQPARPTYRGVIHLWAIDSVNSDDMNLNTLHDAQRLGCRSLVNLIQALVEAEQQQLPRIWIVTRGAQVVADNQQAITIAQAPVWGLGRVLATEHPELWGGIIDLDPSNPADECLCLFQEITATAVGEQLALRKNQRYVARLLRARFDVPPVQHLQFRADATYLITGGLSGIGLEMARWMIQQGARRLILIGRTQIPARSLWNQLDLEENSTLATRIAAVKELEALGASVHLVSLDISDEEQLAMFLAEYSQQGWPPIRGVIHSAGLIKDQLLMRMDQETFDVVNRPKIMGSWLLHRLLRKSPLDFFIMFSSATSIMGMFGQSNYAAGNAFIDALAHYRRSQGLPAMSINWGSWANTGIVARMEINEQLAQSGVIGMSSEQGIQIMARLFQHNPVQAIPMIMDWKQWQQAYPSSTTVPLFKRLFENMDERDNQQSSRENSASQESSFLHSLLLLNPEERQAQLEAHLLSLVASVLRLDRSRIDLEQPLNTLGLDSIMAVELKNRIEVDLGASLSIVELLQGASVAQLAIRVLPDVEEDEDELAALLAEVEQMPLDEVQSLLNDTTF